MFTLSEYITIKTIVTAFVLLLVYAGGWGGVIFKVKELRPLCQASRRAMCRQEIVIRPQIKKKIPVLLGIELRPHD